MLDQRGFLAFERDLAIAAISKSKMEALLQELSDIKSINLKLLIQLSKVLNVSTDVSQSRNVRKGNKENVDKSSIKNSGLNVGTRALKILHHLTKTTLPLFAKERVTDELTLDCLCKCIFRVISCIEDSEHQLAMQPLEFEKAVSNLINRCIEIKEYELALDLIHRVFERLSNERLVLKSNRTASQKKNDKNLGIGEQQKLIGTRSEERSAIIEKKAHRSLLFTVKKEIKSASKVSIVITLMTNALRCWLEGTDRPSIQVRLESFCMKLNQQKMEILLLENQGSIYWCNRLYMLDATAGGKHSDFLYRILYKAAMTEAGIFKCIRSLLSIYRSSSPTFQKEMVSLLFQNEHVI